MNDKIRLIALDLDGTLLNSQKKLSAENRQALEKCIARGIQIVPCTGRNAKEIPEEIKSIRGIHYAVTINGATIEDLQAGEILGRYSLKKETAIEIIQLLKQFHVMYDAYINGEVLYDECFLGQWKEYNISLVVQKYIELAHYPISNFDDYMKNWNGEVDKICFYFSDLNEREEARSILKNRGDIFVSSPIENDLEINALDASKGSGLCRLAAMLGVKQEEIMAFGDENNDLSMIQWAGLGVAMANGIPKLKAIADYVTTSNDESGVAEAIHKFVL